MTFKVTVTEMRVRGGLKGLWTVSNGETLVLKVLKLRVQLPEN
jgi:hypothetical protein